MNAYKKTQRNATTSSKNIKFYIFLKKKKPKQITEYNKSTGRQKNKSKKENKLMKKKKLLNEYRANWRDVSAMSF